MGASFFFKLLFFSSFFAVSSKTEPDSSTEPSTKRRTVQTSRARHEHKHTLLNYNNRKARGTRDWDCVHCVLRGGGRRRRSRSRSNSSSGAAGSTTKEGEEAEEGKTAGAVKGSAKEKQYSM
jgi:hypothetical protein